MPILRPIGRWFAATMLLVAGLFVGLADAQAQAQGKRTKVAIGTDGWPVSARVAARDKLGSHWSR